MSITEKEYYRKQIYKTVSEIDDVSTLILFSTMLRKHLLIFGGKDNGKRRNNKNA